MFALASGVLFCVFLCHGETYHVAGNHDAHTTNLSSEHYFMQIGAAVAKAQAGDTIIIHTGVYRESVDIAQVCEPGKRLIIQSAPHEEVVLTGADLVPRERWQNTNSKDVWVLSPWTYRGCAWSPYMAHPDDEYHRLIGRTEQVIFDGKLLQQVSSQDSLLPGTFYADPLQTRSLYVRTPMNDSPSNHIIEVSVRPILMTLSGSYIVVKDLKFRYGCNMAQRAVLVVEGANNIVDNCIVESTNGAGTHLAGRGNSVYKLISRYNGQIGMIGRGNGNLMQDCLLVDNNVKGFDKGWEAGGIKVVLSYGFHIRGCVALRNNGPGFWFDIDNRNGSVEGSCALENFGPGVMIEISDSIRVQNNFLANNGLKRDPSSWRFAGVLLSESKNCIVENNTCVGNRIGLEIKQSGIRPLEAKETLDGIARRVYYSEGHTIRKNVCTFNQDWQFAYMADNLFFGKHPGADEIMLSAAQMDLLDPSKHGWISESNLYYNLPPQGLFCWGAPWRPGFLSYVSLAAFQKAQSTEGSSIFGDPLFKNRGSGDFTVQPSSPAKTLGAGVPESVIKEILARAEAAKSMR